MIDNPAPSLRHIDYRKRANAPPSKAEPLRGIVVYSGIHQQAEDQKTMEYRLFGRTGVRAAPLCIGAMNFGNPTDEAEALRIIDRALDARINMFDTANS